MIVAVDLHPEKLEMARKLGATHLVQNHHDPDRAVEEIMDITWGRGTDYSIEVVGTEQAMETLSIAFRAIRKAGTMCFVGVGAKHLTDLPIDPYTLTIWRKKVIGVLFGDSQFQTDIPRYIQLMMDGQIDLDAVISKEFRLDGINEVVDNVFAGNRVARQIIRYD